MAFESLRARFKKAFGFGGRARTVLHALEFAANISVNTVVTASR